ncbi:MAG: GIY-YIG nuclease family protein [candidate division Zixibacteria bacterium]|nr:GIY-YIG nuclease family protein [candidate division Zixibacteria bacterium]
MARCADGSIYTGISTDVTARIAKHNLGKGAVYTAGRRPVRLIYQERCLTRSHALRREYQIKHWKRKQKEELALSKP